ncbi:MAG TPA: YrzE family protein [Rubrobacter sp.]|nr:YrzE family protein [Rubrobacter sp.]
MSDRPEESREERRRTGPLGDDADDEETRRVQPANNDSETTRRVPQGRSGEEGGTSPETQRIPQGSSEPEDKETRVIRTPGYADTGGDAAPYPRGYFEAAEEREERLRDMYGGVDWLASFLGFVFAVVLGAVFSAIAGLVLVPFGFPPDLGAGRIGASVITGLVLLGVLIFLTYFFGGYVAGRLARFDGGRNGAMVLAWNFIVVLILALVTVVFSGFLPAGAADSAGNLVDGFASTVSGLAGAGVVGIIAAVAAVLIALLGGFLGGRMGSRYHAEIDRAT